MRHGCAPAPRPHRGAALPSYPSSAHPARARPPAPTDAPTDGRRCAAAPAPPARPGEEAVAARGGPGGGGETRLGRVPAGGRYPGAAGASCRGTTGGRGGRLGLEGGEAALSLPSSKWRPRFSHFPLFLWLEGSRGGGEVAAGVGGAGPGRAGILPCVRALLQRGIAVWGRPGGLRPSSCL